jgi:hypothetical protein
MKTKNKKSLILDVKVGSSEFVIINLYLIVLKYLSDSRSAGDL